MVLQFGNEHKIVRVENLPGPMSEHNFKLHIDAIADDLGEGDYLALRMYQNGEVQTYSICVEQPPKVVTIT